MSTPNMSDKAFDLEEFKRFVESKPADEEYNSWDGCQCALGQFGFKYVADTTAHQYGIPRSVYDAAVKEPRIGLLPKKGYFTFGALRERLEAL